MLPKGSAIQAHPGRDRTPIKVSIALFVGDGKRRSHPSDFRSIPPVFPVGFQSQKQTFITSPINDRFRYAETWPGNPGASHVECSGEAQFEQGLREPERYADKPDQSASRALDVWWLRTAEGSTSAAFPNAP
jgi:hypothetical protein